MCVVFLQAILMATVPLAPLVFAFSDGGGGGKATAYRLFLLLATTGHLSLFPLRESIRHAALLSYRAMIIITYILPSLVMRLTMVLNCCRIARVCSSCSARAG